MKLLQESAIDFRLGSDDLGIDTTPETFSRNKPLIEEILKEAVKQDET